MQYRGLILLICVSTIVCAGYDNNNHNLIPTLTLDELKVLTTHKTNHDLDMLNDEGGKVGAIVITDLGDDYQIAVENLIRDGPDCLDNLEKDPMEKTHFQESFSRRTYATMDGKYPECFNIEDISNMFNEMDGLITCLLWKKLQSTTAISYRVEDKDISIESAPIKEHIHVYDRSVPKSSHIIPFHEDNGLYLIVTPFPGHGLDLKLSNHEVVSTHELDTNSAIVLFGRGLTEWLLQDDLEMKNLFHAVPHSVPSQKDTTRLPRTVYARMKVAHSEAIPASNPINNNYVILKTFQDVFMESETTEYGIHNDLCPITKAQDMWNKNMKQQCDDGEAFCWMGCLPLPDECPNVNDATCYNDSKEPCFDDSMDFTCAWHCK